MQRFFFLLPLRMTIFCMARLITDDTFNRLIVMLAKDEKVAIFNELCTSPKVNDSTGIVARANNAENAEVAGSAQEVK